MSDKEAKVPFGLSHDGSGNMELIDLLAIAIFLMAGSLIYLAWWNERWRKKAREETKRLWERMQQANQGKKGQNPVRE